MFSELDVNTSSPTTNYKILTKCFDYFLVSTLPIAELLLWHSLRRLLPLLYWEWLSGGRMHFGTSLHRVG